MRCCIGLEIGRQMMEQLNPVWPHWTDHLVKHRLESVERDLLAAKAKLEGLEAKALEYQIDKTLRVLKALGAGDGKDA